MYHNNKKHLFLEQLVTLHLIFFPVVVFTIVKSALYSWPFCRTTALSIASSEPGAQPAWFSMGPPWGGLQTTSWAWIPFWHELWRLFFFLRSFRFTSNLFLYIWPQKTVNVGMKKKHGRTEKTQKNQWRSRSRGRTKKGSNEELKKTPNSPREPEEGETRTRVTWQVEGTLWTEPKTYKLSTTGDIMRRPSVRPANPSLIPSHPVSPNYSFYIHKTQTTYTQHSQHKNDTMKRGQKKKERKKKLNRQKKEEGVEGHQRRKDSS